MKKLILTASLLFYLTISYSQVDSVKQADSLKQVLRYKKEMRHITRYNIGTIVLGSLASVPILPLLIFAATTETIVYSQIKSIKNGRSSKRKKN
jgi:hypothetical protein